LNVLLLTQVLPYPPDSGPKVKTWNVIKYLALHHTVTLASFVRGDQSKEVAHLRQYCDEVHTVEMKRGLMRDGMALLQSIFSGEPWLIVRDRREEMLALIRDLCARRTFDVVHADQLNMAQYALAARQARRVVDEHNALWMLYQRMAGTMPQGPRKWLLERDWRLLQTYEGRICRDFDAVLTVSDVDKNALEKVAGELPEAYVIPIAVDTDEVAPVKRSPRANHIVHVGTMYWPPNIDGILWFAREVLPKVRAILPEVEFDIIGAKPPEEIRRLAEEDPRIHVTGYVEDVNGYLENAGVLIVPLRAGGGMRVKILNALSQELPMVSTTIGVEGIMARDGQELLIADAPEEFAQAVVRLLQDHPLGEELGRNGRVLIQEHYDYRKVCGLLEQAYQDGSGKDRPI